MYVCTHTHTHTHTHIHVCLRIQVSLNAAMFVSVMLASRASSNMHVALLMCSAVEGMHIFCTCILLLQVYVFLAYVYTNVCTHVYLSSILHLMLASRASSNMHVALLMCSAVEGMHILLTCILLLQIHVFLTYVYISVCV